MIDKLTPKEKRIISREINNLFLKGGLIYSGSYEEISNLEFPPFKIVVNDDEIYVSTIGKTTIRRMCRIIIDKSPFDDLLSYEDVFKGILDVTQDTLTDYDTLDLEEFTKSLDVKLTEKIQNFSFISKVHGLLLSESACIKVGKREIRYFNEKLLPTIPEKHSSYIDSLKEHFDGGAVIVGKERGSGIIAQEKFLFNVKLSLSVIRLYACATYRYSIYRLNISSDGSNAVNGTSDSNVTIRWVHGSDSLHATNGSSGRISLEESELLPFQNISCCLSSLIDKKDKTNLEDKLIKSLFWFGEAQKDYVHASAWVKLWSSLECFFKLGGESISEDNASGISSILLCGNGSYEGISDFDELKSELKKFYAKRSRIVHHSSYAHIDKNSLDEFAYMVSWSIIGIALLVEEGVEKNRPIA